MSKTIKMSRQSRKQRVTEGLLLAEPPREPTRRGPTYSEALSPWVLPRLWDKLLGLPSLLFQTVSQ